MGRMVINEVIDNQVRSLRVRQVIAGYQTNHEPYGM